MAKIVFLMDIEEGHLLPSFALAHSLKRRGHEICYLSVIDNEELVKAQGFTFKPIFEKWYPRDFRRKMKRLPLAENGKNIRPFDDLKYRRLEQIADGSYDACFGDMQADMVIISVFLRVDIFLLYYKFNIRPVILTPFLREPGKTLAAECMESFLSIPPSDLGLLIEHLMNLNKTFTSMTQIIDPVNTLHELILCPLQFEIEGADQNPKKRYIGPSIRKKEGVANIRSLYGIPGNKGIIYASIGSQGVRYREHGEHFFRKMINAMKSPEMQHLHMVLSIGPEYDKDLLALLPPNITALSWVAQIDVLEVAVVAVIHGGLGTVKECIYYGVPMLVFPIANDQPMNAQRVSHHKLGISGDITTISEKELLAHILDLSHNVEIRQSVEKIRDIFREQDKSELGAKVVETILASGPL